MGLIAAMALAVKRVRDFVVRCALLSLVVWLAFDIIFAVYESLGGCSIFESPTSSGSSGDQSWNFCLSDLAVSLVALVVGIAVYIGLNRKWRRMQDATYRREISARERKYMELP